MKLLTEENKLVFLEIIIMGFICEYTSGNISILLPNIISSLHISAFLANWISLSLMLTSVSSGLMITKIIIKNGLIRSLKILFIIMLISTLISIIPNIYIIILSKAIQGFAIAGIFLTTYLLIYNQLTEDKIIKALSYNTFVSCACLIFIPILSGFLISVVNWQIVFLVNIPLILIGLTLSFLLKNERKENKKIDIIGSILSFFGIILVVFGFSNIYNKINLIFFIIGIIMLIAFIKYELNCDDPLYDFRLFKNKFYKINNIFTITMIITSTVMLYATPICLQYIRNLTPLLTSIIIAIYPLSATITSLFVDKMVKYKNEITITKYGMILSTIGCLIIFISIYLQSSYLYILSLTIMGMGLSMFEITNQKLILDSVPTDKLDDATSLLNFLRDFGILFGMTFITLIMGYLEQFLISISLYQVVGIILLILILFLGIFNIILFEYDSHFSYLFLI